ncbi:MAG TPA: site-2 protease family protein [Methanomassiliicoccales archaeon]|nr:site-2 protease family protein [Methanomassiliicoccales archaeon]
MEVRLGTGRGRHVMLDMRATLFLILPLFALIFGFGSLYVEGMTLGYGDLPIGPVEKFLLGTFSGLIFLLSFILHELAHCVMAQHFEHDVKGITLHVFGGASEYEPVGDRSRGEVSIAAAGPLVSLGLGLPLAYLYLTFLTEPGPLVPQILAVTVALLAAFNLLLGVFNVLPAYPMDGGMALMAYLARKRDTERTVIVAARAGRILAVIMVVIGVFLPNFIPIAIGVYLYIAAEYSRWHWDMMR